ncbi:MAG: tetratricopeptide repeat protein [Acidiferrobacter sp.]
MKQGGALIKRFLASRAAIMSLIAAAALASAILTVGLKSAHKPTISKPPARASDQARLLDRAANQLIGGPRGYTPLFATALAARAAINRGDFASAGEMIQAVEQRSHVQGWGFAPFAAFISDVVEPGNAGFLRHLDAWVAVDQGSATPYLLRALYDYDTGWLIRGHGFVNHIERRHLKGFAVALKAAYADISQAMRRDANNPYSAYLRLRILGGNGNTPEMEAAFRQSIRRFPNYYPLYDLRLDSLQPVWGGSPQAMYTFVDTYAGRSPVGSPLRMLYLQLYANLLSTASVICASNNKVPKPCAPTVIRDLVSKSLESRVGQVLHEVPRTGKIAYTMELGRILQEMIDIQGSDPPVGALLQTAAEALKSQNALVASDTSKNNFMMDKLTGQVWYQAGQFDNAKTLFKRALADLNNAHYQSAEVEDQIRAGLYRNLAAAYNQEHRFRKVAVYQRAADLLGGPGDSTIGCAALFRLKLYSDAIEDCTAQIDTRGNRQAFFWRGRAYDGTGKTSLALRDYRIVAGSESPYRSYAAIAISVIYGRENDMPAMAKALDTYQYLYDPAREDKSDIAIAYNNRCYAEMHMGELHRALSDCTASLRFGNLPDAYAKQHEITRLLKERTPAGPRPKRM